MPTINQLVRKGRQAGQIQNGQSGAAEFAAEAWRLHARLYADAEEAELGAAQSGARSSDQRHRGYDLHSGRWTQLAGALDRVDSRRPR